MLKSFFVGARNRTHPGSFANMGYSAESLYHGVYYGADIL